jgi:hypothetical protein
MITLSLAKLVAIIVGSVVIGAVVSLLGVWDALKQYKKECEL